MSKSEYLLKICIVGIGGIQKTEFIRKYAEDKFDGNYLPTLGVDITTKKITIKGIKTKLILVDTAGQEFFGKLRPNYYRGASGALIFCNLYNRESIESIPIWLKEFKRHIPSPDIPISILVLTTKIENAIEMRGKPIRPKHPRRKRTLQKIIERIMFFSKKKRANKKTVKRRKVQNDTPKEWEMMSNSELVSHLALKYDLGLCKVDMEKAGDISKCFTHIAEQVIGR